ncbi:MAG: hypothetical protein HKL82_02825 [Acidimicrobiaceae bacterium]|nr:hypothetical protein [Acidimicrobiaceae bacterium]
MALDATSPEMQPSQNLSQLDFVDSHACFALIDNSSTGADSLAFTSATGLTWISIHTTLLNQPLPA